MNWSHTTKINFGANEKERNRLKDKANKYFAEDNIVIEEARLSKGNKVIIKGILGKNEEALKFYLEFKGVRFNNYNILQVSYEIIDLIDIKIIYNAFSMYLL